MVCNVLLWPIESILANSKNVDEATRNKLINEIADNIIPELSKQAALIPIAESGIIALDWMNGRRTPDANQNLKGAITGLNLVLMHSVYSGHWLRLLHLVLRKLLTGLLMRAFPFMG